MKTILADDFVDMSAASPTRSGLAAREAFRSQVEDTHAKFKPTLKVTFEELQAFGDWAFGRGLVEVTLDPRQGGPTTYVRQRFLEIWKRQADGQRRICRIMDN